METRGNTTRSLFFFCYVREHEKHDDKLNMGTHLTTFITDLNKKVLIHLFVQFHSKHLTSSIFTFLCLNEADFSHYITTQLSSLSRSMATMRIYSRGMIILHTPT